MTAAAFKTSDHFKRPSRIDPHFSAPSLTNFSKGNNSREIRCPTLSPTGRVRHRPHYFKRISCHDSWLANPLNIPALIGRPFQASRSTLHCSSPFCRGSPVSQPASASNSSHPPCLPIRPEPAGGKRPHWRAAQCSLLYFVPDWRDRIESHTMRPLLTWAKARTL